MSHLSLFDVVIIYPHVSTQFCLPSLLDPATAGRDHGAFMMKDFLQPVMGEAFTLKDHKDRSPEESAKWNKWCGLLKYYLALRRVGYQPSFGSDNTGA